MRMPSNLVHQFSVVPKINIPRSTFDRSHTYKTTFDSGYLIPILVDEALPGDTFNLKPTVFARLLTPIVPIMDNMYLDTFYFAVPYRLVWSNWERFNGAQDNPGDSTDYTIPQMVSTASTGYAIGSLHDYLGLPTGIAGYTHNSLWHRAYNLIYNQWFRDENLINSVTVDTGNGPDLPANYVLKRRGKRGDYFTTCLPFAQKGTAVTMPISGTAPVKGIGKENQTFGGTPTVYETGGSGTTSYTYGAAIDFTQAARSFWVKGTAATGGYPAIYADLSAATSSTINAWRLALQSQAFLELDARGGTRYTEIILAHFGCVSPDFRLQRAEYLGGTSVPININPVAQTSATDTAASSQTPQGNLAAYAQVASHGGGFVKSFTEHCLILGIANVRADLTYQQGLDRMFSRSTRYDFYWPSFAHLGEQAVLNKEIYLQGTSDDANTFGYQERHAEYRFKISKITGKFRSTASGTLDKWHLSEKFTSLPTLGETFINSTPPVDRVVAVTSQPQFQLDAYFKYICARPMPLYGVPGSLARL